MPIAALIIAFAATVSGGTALAAENALPGDLLYPVKTEVTEELRAVFALDAEAKAEWETKRLERRSEELDRLETAGRIDTETRATIEARMEDRAERVAERAEGLREKRPEISERLRARLQAVFESRTDGTVDSEEGQNADLAGTDGEEDASPDDTDAPKNFGHEVRMRVRGKLMDPEARTRFHEFMKERQAERRDEARTDADASESAEAEVEADGDAEVSGEAGSGSAGEAVIDAEAGLNLEANGLLR